MIKKLYEVVMTTQNPSADKRGYFSTRAKAEKEIVRLSKVCTNKEYYGEIVFEIKEETLVIDSPAD